MDANSSVCSIKIKNDILVTVPASTRLMTTYVLQEQEDWFEDEIDFLRTIIKPGMNIIDIGANYGVYALTLSKLVADTGKIWAFEPTEATAECLRKSIAENSFTNIELIRAGLSNRNGEARFFTCPNSEWNSLSELQMPGSSSETVKLHTLDHCHEKYEWKDIDFLKLDAEGEELKILEQGKKFLAAESPLIMYELKHGENLNMPLIDGFDKSGYDNYRYVPGLNILVPFESQVPVDSYQLNLFACKKDRASELESSGVLLIKENQLECSPDIEVTKEHLRKFPYWEILRENISFENNSSEKFLEIISLYIQATSSSKTAGEKFNCLRTALNHLKVIVEQGEEKIERLATCSRIAFDAGERAMGMKLLTMILERHYNNLNFDISEPFLPALAKFETIDPKSNIKPWLISSVLEQFVIKHAYSTYFSQNKMVPLLNRLEQLGFMDEDMARRKKLIESVHYS